MTGDPPDWVNKILWIALVVVTGMLAGGLAYAVVVTVPEPFLDLFPGGQAAKPWIDLAATQIGMAVSFVTASFAYYLRIEEDWRKAGSCAWLLTGAYWLATGRRDAWRCLGVALGCPVALYGAWLGREYERHPAIRAVLDRLG